MLRSAPTTPRWVRAGAAFLIACATATGSFVAGGCGASEPPAFQPDSAFAHVERQLAYGPRTPGSPARDRAARMIAHTLERNGARVSVQSFEVTDPYGAGKLRLMNVIGSFAPDRPRRIMLCAHYDSRPWADQEADTTRWNTPIPAAVDGAAGVAILLEMGRLLGRKLPADVGVDLVFFDGEDYGKEGDPGNYLLGSKHFAANLNGYRPACAILLDMVGGRGTRVEREGFSVQRSSALVDYVFGRAATLGLDYLDSQAGGPMYDDHVPLLQAGLDAMDLFGYGYGAWHTLGDDITQVDRGLMGQVGTLLRDVVYNFRYHR
jgi:Peptidase family M28